MMKSSIRVKRDAGGLADAFAVETGLLVPLLSGRTFRVGAPDKVGTLVEPADVALAKVSL